VNVVHKDGHGKAAGGGVGMALAAFFLCRDVVCGFVDSNDAVMARRTNSVCVLMVKARAFEIGELTAVVAVGTVADCRQMVGVLAGADIAVVAYGAITGIYPSVVKRRIGEGVCVEVAEATIFCGG